MSENRKQILEMLAQGKINADEAERLIAALEREPAQAQAASDAAQTTVAKPRPKYLRVAVESANEYSHGGQPTKVNIRVPLALLRAGVRLGNLIPPQARDKANAAMREQGIDIDLNKLKPENIEELIDQIQDVAIDVDEDRAKVRIFCE
jgi:hypothetical protein